MIQMGVTLRSRYKTGVDFDKIYVFCGKCCVLSDKCVSIIVKIKCVNSGNIVILVINLTLLQTTHILSKHTQILQFLISSTERSHRGT